MCEVYNINMGPMKYFHERECNVLVLRGQTLMAITATYALINGIKFGEELSQQVEEWKASGSRFGLVYQHSLSMLDQLVLHTSLPNLSIESFLRQPTSNMKIVKGEHDN